MQEKKEIKAMSKKKNYEKSVMKIVNLEVNAFLNVQILILIKKVRY